MRKLLLAMVLLLVMKVQVFADDALLIRLEEPKSPTVDQDFPITFVVLDTVGGRTVHVTCEKRYESEGYSQFYSTNLPADGNTGICQITSAITNRTGNYTIRATATAGTNSSVATTSFNYTNEYPGTPRDYSKNKIESCKYEIKFKTADDNGLTTKVEIYRSTDTSFGTDSGTRIAEIGVGSNTEKTYVDTIPDCNKTYYYAVRAFGNAGNGSGIVGDKEIKIINTETTSETASTTEVSAIPVGGGSILGVTQPQAEPGAEGSVLGMEEDASGSAATLSGMTTDDTTGDLTQEKNGVNWGIVAVLTAIGAGMIWVWRRFR